MNLKEKWVTAFEAFPHKDDILKDIRKEALNFFAVMAAANCFSANSFSKKTR